MPAHGANATETDGQALDLTGIQAPQDVDGFSHEKRHCQIGQVGIHEASVLLHCWLDCRLRYDEAA